MCGVSDASKVKPKHDHGFARMNADEAAFKLCRRLWEVAGFEHFQGTLPAGKTDKFGEADRRGMVNGFGPEESMGVDSARDSKAI